MIAKFISAVLTFLIFVSCSSRQKNDAAKDAPHPALPYHIDIEKNINNFKVIPASALGKNLRYIPLETKPQSLLKRIDYIEFSHDFIFASDFDKLLQFDREGRFIRQIGSNGRGPAEYIYVIGFCVDEKQERIYLLAWGISTVLEFDFRGKFLRSFKVPFESLRPLKNDHDNFVYPIPNGSQIPDSEYRIIVTDSTGKVKIRVKNHNRFIEKNGLVSFKIPMYFFKDTIRILESRVDTLNTFAQNKHRPYAIFSLGDSKMKADISIPFQSTERESLTNSIKDKIWIWTLSENNPYLFIGFNLGISDSTRHAVFNKLSAETVFLKDNGFRNDLGINIPFWPKYVYHDSILVDYQEAYKFLNAVKKDPESAKKPGISPLIKSLTETSNPVLVILE